MKKFTTLTVAPLAIFAVALTGCGGSDEVSNTDVVVSEEALPTAPSSGSAGTAPVASELTPEVCEELAYPLSADYSRSVQETTNAFLNDPSPANAETLTPVIEDYRNFAALYETYGYPNISAGLQANADLWVLAQSDPAGVDQQDSEFAKKSEEMFSEYIMGSNYEAEIESLSLACGVDSETNTGEISVDLDGEE